MITKILTTAVVSLWVITASASNEPSTKISATADKTAAGNFHATPDKHKSKKSFVKLSAFKLADKNGKIFLEMDKAGIIKQEGKAIASIDKTGSVFDTRGKLMASLRDNGVLEDSKGNPLVKIKTDGTLDNESGVLIHWMKNGTLSQGDKTLDVKLLPPNSTARRAASIVFFLYSNPGEATSVEIPTKNK